MARGVKRLLQRAADRVSADISQRDEGKYERGLSAEGYAGGYLQALYDVALLLNGVTPNARNYWGEESFLDSVIEANKRKPRHG